MHFALYLLAITCSVLISTTLFGVLYLLWRSQSQFQQLLTSQAIEIRRQNNLLASKDLSTFSTIQTLSTTETSTEASYDPNFIPRDDKSLANAIAQQYRDAGIDPNSAYDSPDDAIADFGGPGSFI